jgi:multiple antibiotic resistance protein
MHETTGLILTAFMGFFAIMNPIANTPVFLGLTASDSTAIRRRIAFKALLITFILIVTFILLGKLIFSMFGITLPAFQITGGILVFIIGLQMLHGQQSKLHSPAIAAAGTGNMQGALSLAVTPLAMPILGGPGTIAAAMNFSSGGGITGMLVTIIAFGLLCLVTYIFFITGERLVKFLGEEGLMMVTRLMGLILAVIGTQMFITGVAGAVKASS